MAKWVNNLWPNGWIWKNIRTFAAQKARACEEFDTTPQEAEAFVTEFLEQLEKEGVIEK